MDANWSVIADRERCSGSGMCTVYTPGTFSQDADARVVVADPPLDDLEAVLASIEACPTRALALITGAKSNEQGV